jgi:hypothetical protein
MVEPLGPISQRELIAAGRSIRELPRLRKFYGTGRRRKLKGVARVLAPDGTMKLAEIHWYEAHGIGKKEFKIKRFID